jgi:Glycosyl hydrolases family 38 N-terminal domain
MQARELVLLSPHRFPTDSSPILGSDEIACFLNAWSVLWHPALLLDATGPPRVAYPYDHENPGAGSVYALPENPQPTLPADWEQKAHAAGAIAFQAGPERAQTLASLEEALEVRQGKPEASQRRFAEAELAPFFAIGLGHALVVTLFEAMEHENTLASADFWQAVQQAAQSFTQGDQDATRQHLQVAADCLRTAREVLYPVEIYWLDLCLLGDKSEEQLLPRAVEAKTPMSLMTAASTLAAWEREYPERLAAVRAAVESDKLEVCGGVAVEHDDAELPVESQLWNLRKGQEEYKRLLGRPVKVFARRRFGVHPHTPLLLQSNGIRHAVLVPFDDAVLPSYRGTIVNWPSPDGKQVESLTRMPHSADLPQTFFHLAAYLRQTIAEDHAATLALLHRRQPACPWYEDLLGLQSFGPVFGNWFMLSNYLGEVQASEYASASTPDEFRGDVLGKRVDGGDPAPVSYFAGHARARRRLDQVRTLVALQRSWAGSKDPLNLAPALAVLEDEFEKTGVLGSRLDDIQKSVMDVLASGLLARAQGQTPGTLLLNPCGHTRRAVLQMPHEGPPLPLDGPIRAAQFSAGMARLVVEVPGLGFAWIPRSGPAGTPAPAGRLRLADGRCVRNEFFEAEIDSDTGGLRAFRDLRKRVNHLGQQLVYNPGSVMRVRDIRVTSTGPALGELISEGDVLDDKQHVLASYQQTLRAWLGRPLLELNIKIDPVQPVRGHAWHAYFASRFAWRDERAVVLRGVFGPGYTTTTAHPETPDYLEIRSSATNTVIFPGGLPFWQRQGGRMVDLLLLTEGEQARSFDVGLCLDWRLPLQTAQGLISPMPALAVEKGPPHVGAAGWLFHLNATNLLITSMEACPDGRAAIIVRVQETHLQAGQAEMRCVRNPKSAQIVDAQGNVVAGATVQDDAVLFDFAPGDLLHLRVEFE